MTAKEYLNQLKWLDLKIKHRIEQRDELRNKELYPGVELDPEKVDVQSSINPHKTEDNIVRYLDMEEEINKLVDEYVELKHKIITMIHQLDDAQYIDCLHQRYVEFHSFELIAVNMDYSIRRIYQIHGDALQAFKRKHCI